MEAKRSEYLKKIEDMSAAAKKYGTKNKTAALNALRRKKQYEKQLQTIDRSLSATMLQTQALENAQINTEGMKNMSIATSALKSAIQPINVDDIHNVMDDFQEHNERAEEITGALYQPIGFVQEIDEDDLLVELEGLEKEELEFEPSKASNPGDPIGGRSQSMLAEGAEFRNIDTNEGFTNTTDDYGSRRQLSTKCKLSIFLTIGATVGGAIGTLIGLLVGGIVLATTKNTSASESLGIGSGVGASIFAGVGIGFALLFYYVCVYKKRTTYHIEEY